MKELFRNIVTSAAGTILIFASIGLYYSSFFIDVLSDVSWKHCIGGLIVGLWMLAAKDNDIMYPAKAIMSWFANKNGVEKQPTSNDENKDETKPEVK
jgi:hypothetical protein